MAKFKDTTNAIIDWFDGHGDVNEVTFGDGGEVDLSSQKTLPLVHVIPVDATFEVPTTNYVYQVIIVGQTVEDETQAKLDILDLCAGVAAEFTKSVEGGYLFDSDVRLDGAVSSTTIYKDRQNVLFGWALTVGLKTLNKLQHCG